HHVFQNHDDQQLDIDGLFYLEDEGRYEIFVSEPQNEGRTARAHLQVREGQSPDPVVLELTDGDSFSGKKGNGVTVSDAIIAPGEKTTVRLTYKNAGKE